LRRFDHADAVMPPDRQANAGCTDQIIGRTRNKQAAVSGNAERQRMPALSSPAIAVIRIAQPLAANLPSC